MHKTQLRELLDAVAQGATSVPDALERLSRLPFADLGFARVDHHRALRSGVPEVVLAEGKQTEHLIAIIAELATSGSNVLVTRVSAAQAEAARAQEPRLRYLRNARLLILEQRPIENRGRGTVLVLTAGTSDLGVAEEAAVTARLCGSAVEQISDVGVAGLHRLLAYEARLRDAAVIIVVAGMEGALPSVVAGLSGRPVIAVPTSVGYGASFGGAAALLGMLSSCAAGVVTVNIDNGFGAGYAAALLNRPLSSEGA